MKIKDLIGFQIVSIDEEQIVVSKDGVTHTLEIYQDTGDCCGFNEVTTSLLISSDELSKNPVIVDVEFIRTTDGDCYGDGCKLTFFGEYNPIATLNSYSSSGSGWCYGASVSLVCKPLDLAATVTCW